MELYLDRVYHPVETLGPGSRVGIWTSGCSRRCPGCANPELQDRNELLHVSTSRLAGVLAHIALERQCHRLTVTGGEPLEQAPALSALLAEVRPFFDDVLVYTGFRLEEIPRAIGEAEWNALRPNIDAIVDGPYVEALNDGACALRGSSNQRIVVLNDNLRRAYDEAAAGPRRVQNAVFGSRAISIGIHGRRKEQQ